jgi:Tetracyclin repressor-like, C-terminal domain
MPRAILSLVYGTQAARAELERAILRAALGLAAYRELVVADRELPDTGELRGDVLELLRRANRHLSSPAGDILRSLLGSARDDPRLLEQLREQTADAGSGTWLTVLGRAVARGEAPPEALHIVDEVYLPLVRGRG